MSNPPANDPEALLDMIEAEFMFLVELGFCIVVEDDNIVRYERNDGVFVRIVYDPRERHVGYRVGLASRSRDALDGRELVRLSGVAGSRRQYPERANELHASVAQVAQELREHGKRPLAGDEAIYDEAMERRRANTLPFTREGSAG